MPPPFTMLFTVLLMLVTLPLRFATLLLVFAELFATFDTLFETLFTFASSDCSWLTFTASVAFRPAATFVIRRSAPAAPTDTSPPAAVAAEIAVPPTGVKPAVASVARVRHRVRAQCYRVRRRCRGCTTDCHSIRTRCRRISQRRVGVEVLDAATVHDVVHRVVDVGDVTAQVRDVVVRVRQVVRNVRNVVDVVHLASSDCNWLTFTASVALRPAATFVMRRSAPALPTDTSPPAAVAAEIAVPPVGVKPAVASVAEFATEFEPSATEFAVVADAAPPIATAFVPVADESASVELRVEILDAATVHDVVHRVVDVRDVAAQVCNVVVGVRQVVRDVRHLVRDVVDLRVFRLKLAHVDGIGCVQTGCDVRDRRSAPAVPTDTSPPAAVAAEIAVPPTGVKPAVVNVAEFATAPAPSATEFTVAAEAPCPSATVFIAVALECRR